MSILARLNSPKSEFLNPYKLIFFANFNPFAIAKETLTAEKLPGPLFIKSEKFLSIFTLYFFIRFNMVITN